MLGVVTAVVLAPSQTNLAGQSVAESGVHILLALTAAMPAFILGAVALGALGVMAAVRSR